MNDTFNMENMGNSPNELDSKIMSLAIYDSSNGRISIPKDSEEYVAIVKKAAKTFNVFKTYIQTGECTFSDLNQMVMARCGPNLKSKRIDIDKNPDLYIEDILSDVSIREQREAAIRKSATSDLLSSILSQFANGSLANAQKIDLGNGVEARVVHMPYPMDNQQNPFIEKEKLNQPNQPNQKKDMSADSSLYNKQDVKAQKAKNKKKPKKTRKGTEDSK